MKRGRPKLKLTMSDEERDELRRIFRKTTDAKAKERCQALLMANQGTYTHEQIAQQLCRSRSTIQRWITNFKEEGFEALESRQGREGGRPTEMRSEELITELKAGLKEGRWTRAADVADWLRREHGIERSKTSIHYWLGKAGGL